MAKKVLQDDGKYCYTENCKIHNRGSANSLVTVIKDVEKTFYRNLGENVADVIRSEANSLGLHPSVSGKSAEIAREVVAEIMSGSNASYGTIAHSLHEKLVNDGSSLDSASEETIDKFYRLGYSVYDTMTKATVIAQGDEVIIASTGARGRVMEGGSSMGGRLRVEEENPKGSNYQWFQPTEVLKLFPSESALAREHIVASPRFDFNSGETIAKLFDEESSNLTENPQGLKGLNPKEQAVARIEFMDSGRRVAAGVKNGWTRDRLAGFVRNESERRFSWLEPEYRDAVKKSYKNLLDYLELRKK